MAKLFEVGTKTQFDALKVKDENIIYWITDTQELYRGNTLYAVGREATETTAGLMSAEDKQLLLALNALVSNNVNTISAGDYGVAVASATEYAAPAVVDMAYTPAAMDMAEVNGEIAAYSGWESDTEHYPWYDCYYDEEYSYIDANKNITIDKGQINLTEESYAQFVPFEMKRYYDGIDLSTMTISLVYVTRDGYEGEGEIVNMQYGTDTIRFAWLIDEKVTHVAGDVRFEINARGTVVDSTGLNYRAYVWKSKTGSGINVAHSLTSGRKIELDDSWMTELVNSIALRITEQIAEELANAQIDVLAENAEKAAERAEKAAQEAESVVQAGLADVNTRIDNTNARIEEVSSNIPTDVSQLNNDAGYLTEHQSLEGLATEDFVKDEIAKVNVKDQLVDYAKTSEVEDLVGDIGDSENVVDYVNDAISAKNGNLVDDENNPLTVEDYVKQEIANADIDNKLVAYAKTSEVETLIGDLDQSENVVSYVETTIANKMGTLVDNENNPLTVEDYVNKKIEEIDVSEQIGDLGVDDEGNPIATVVDYVNGKIEKVDVSEQLQDYATTVSLNEVKTSLDTVNSNTVTNAENIADVQNEIQIIQDTLNSFKGDNENLIVQYDKSGSMLHLYEKDENGDVTITDGNGEIKVKEISSTVIIGTGGSGSVSTIKISVNPDGENTSTILYGSEAFLNYNLSTREGKEGDDGEIVYEEAIISGNIIFTLYKDDVYITQFTVKKTSSEVQSGNIDISEYVGLGSQVFSVRATYLEQLGDGETVTVRSNLCKWMVNAVNLKLTNLPDSVWESTVKYGSTTFSYTPVGALEKTVYFKIDNKEPETVVTSLNGTALTYIIPQQTHGVHTLQVWCEGYVGGTLISTEPNKYVLMFAENGNNTPIIRIKAPTTLEQYSSDYIYYNVFDPLNAIIDSVTLYDEDGVILSSVKNITSVEQKWEFRPTVVKNKTITIEYKETTESVMIEVTKFPYEINAVIGDLMVDFVPTGRTNSDADYDVFKNNAYTVEKDNDTGEETQIEIPITWDFSSNFDWINGGWKIDENNDTYFCIKAGTFVNINYNLFGTDGVVAKKDANGNYTIAGTGKEFKVIFKTTNVAQANATWLECIGIADKNSLGIRMEAQNAYIDSTLGTLEIPYVDDDIIEFDMNIVPITKFLENGEPNLATKTIPMIITYEDGTPVQPKVITSASTNLKQDTPQPITIGSEYCDVHIYRMKVYERYLEDKEILTNFIADARSGVEMAKRYVRNNIYPIEDAQRITPESVATACPDLKVYVLSAPYFTNDKGDKVENTTIRQLHNTGTRENPEWDINENWTATGAIHNGQGTSSNEYGYSGRNLEFNMKKATITLGDNVTVVKEIQLSPTSYPTNYLNFKINIASSENVNNALLQKRYDRYLPYTTLAALMDNRKKNSMEFFNCVVFIQETGDISTHREFDNCDIQFYGIGNIGDSKKTDSSRVNDANDPNEFCVEIMDWNRELSSFPSNTIVNAMKYTTDPDTNEKIYAWAKDENLDILYELIDGEYVLTKDTTVDLTKTYYVDALENDDFSEDYTYGWRYLWEDGSDEENTEAFNSCKQKWIDFYRFITRDLTTNGKEDSNKVNAWKSEFSNWFILDAALYYYLYTLRYTMVDNRAKNSFYHWGKHYITFKEAVVKGITVYDEDKNLIIDASHLPSTLYDVNNNEITIEEAIESHIAVYDKDKNLIMDASNLPSIFYDVNGKVIENINAEKAAINDGYRMEFWMYDNDTALGIDNAGKLEIPFGVEDSDTDSAGVPYFRAHDSLIFVRIAKYFVKELEDAWYNTEINPIGKVFNSVSFIDEFDAWQGEFPEELWRLDYERKYKRTYVGGKGEEWNGALPQSNKSDITSTRFLTEMMNGRKKYQRRCFERNQEIYMSSKFKGEVNRDDTITLRGTGDHTGTNKVVPYNSTITITPFSKMYINLYNSTSQIYYHAKHEAGVPVSIDYPNTVLDFIYVRGGSQIQSLGDLSPMYLQTATLTSGSKLKIVTLGNATDGYSNNSLKALEIGAGNRLLEELDIRNLSNLENTVLPVTNIPSLKRVYAQGSNITEARFANNGLLEEAYLPETITRLELRNLHYLKVIELESYDNLLYLTMINCSDVMNNLVLDMINKASDLVELEITNINWNLDDTTILKRLYKLIKTPDVSEKPKEVKLSGSISVPIIKQKELEDYNKVWPDLQISYSTLIPQYKITFVNYNGEKLEEQYVDEGSYPVDPVTRENNPIEIPTKESSVSTDFTYAGWDSEFIQVFTGKTYTATYSETIRQYTVQYVSMDKVKETYTASYGSMVHYQGEIPIYIAEEEAYKYYLFSHWDQSGYVNGNKTINAVFDTFKYTDGYFDNKDFSELTPVEIYGLLRVFPETYTEYISLGDTHDLRLGVDYDYEDEEVKSKLLIGEEREFNGSGKDYIDTGELLFDKDKDFVLAIDFELSSQSASGSVLAECYADNGNRGFKLSHNTYAKVTWNTSNQVTIAKTNRREMLVLRHKKGDTNLYIYSSNAEKDQDTSVNIITDGIIESSLTMENDIKTSTLVFGCERTVDGFSENPAIGKIYWSKIWYADLGEDICKNIASYPREEIGLKVSGFRRFYRSDATTTRTAITFVTQNALSNPISYNNGANCAWGDSVMCAYLNNGFYNSIPTVWKQLFKSMVIKTTAGDRSSDIVETGSYVALPAASDMSTMNSGNNNLTVSPYIDEISPANAPMGIFTDKDSRKLTDKNGNAISYWLRSPTITGSTWMHTVNYEGQIYPWQNPATYMDNSDNKIYVYARPMLSI